MWLNNLKIAIIEKDTRLLDELLDNLPQLSDPKEIEQAIYLLREASTLELMQAIGENGFFEGEQF